jgi:hypothetical protein
VPLALTLATVLVVSAFLNNIPVVIIFIPIMQGLAARFGRSVSQLMIPLSYAAVLGGMTTLIGSSTNLLVNSALIEMAERPFAFFDFTVPGLILAGTGLVHVVFVAPRLLPVRESLADVLLEGRGKQFIAQITLTADSDLVGKGAPGGIFPGLADMTVRMAQRGEQPILPPFEDYTAQPGDVLVVAATRQALTEALANDRGVAVSRFAGRPRVGSGRRPAVGGRRLNAGRGDGGAGVALHRPDPAPDRLSLPHAVHRAWRAAAFAYVPHPHDRYPPRGRGRTVDPGPAGRRRPTQSGPRRGVD